MVFWLKPPGLQNVPKHVLQAILRALDISIQTSADEADATLSRQLNSNTRALQIAVRDKILQLVENYKAAIRRTISISEDPLYIQVKGSVNRLARVFRILHDRISNTTPGDTVLGGFDERGQYVAEGRPPGATAVAPSMGDLPPNYSAANNGLAAFEPPPPSYAASQRAMAQGHHTSVRGGPPTSSRPTTYASVAATSATAATSTMARPTSAAPSPRQGPLPDLIASTGPNGLLRHTAASTATGPPLVSSGARVPTSAPHPMMGSQANIGIDPFANLALIGNSMGPVSYPSGPFVAPRTAQDISHPLLPNANYTVPERPSMTTTQPTPGPPITTPQVEVSQALPVASNYGPWPFTPFDDGLAGNVSAAIAALTTHTRHSGGLPGRWQVCTKGATGKGPGYTCKRRHATPGSAATSHAGSGGTASGALSDACGPTSCSPATTGTPSSASASDATNIPGTSSPSASGFELPTVPATGTAASRIRSAAASPYPNHAVQPAEAGLAHVEPDAAGH